MGIVRLEVEAKEGTNFNELMSKMCKVPFLFRFDTKNNIITLENVSEQSIDAALDIIKNYYEIVQTEVDGRQEASEDGNNVAIEKAINRLWRTVYWAMYQKGISERKLERLVTDTVYRISQKYNGYIQQEIKPGDVVRCNYGWNLRGEISGIEMLSVVCKVNPSKGEVFVVPIVRRIRDAEIYLDFTAKKDMVGEKNNSFTGYVICEKARSIYIGRVVKQEGELKKTYFKKILRKIPTAFKFMDEAKSTKTSDMSDEERKRIARFSGGHAVKTLDEIFGDKLSELDICQSVESKLEMFLNILDFQGCDEHFKNAFLLARKTEKITYGNVMQELLRTYPEMDAKKFMTTLKGYAKEWKNKHPEEYSSIHRFSISDFWKLFVAYTDTETQ